MKQNEKLSLEDELLVVCCRLHLTSTDRKQLSGILSHEALSWPEALGSARRHYLTAFLFYHLQHPEFQDSVPPWAVEELRRTYFRNGLKNHLLRTELGKILQKLQNGGIPVMALKGAALLETVYPNASLRPMADIDLLVPEDQADAAHSLVCESGYAPVGSLEEQAKTRAVHQHLPKLVDSRELVKFEIHNHIVARDSPFRFDISTFWKNARPATVAGIDVQIPAPEHLILHLAIHFFLDRRFRSVAALRQICDIAETVRHYQDQIDWDWLAAEARDQGLGGPLHCGLYLAQSLLDAPIPNELMNQLTPKGLTAASMDLFLKRRILDRKRVICSEWVKPQTSYNLPHLAGGILSRVFPKPAYLEARYSDPTLVPDPVRLYLRRLGDGLRLLGEYFSNPVALWQELRVDRWMHSISSKSPANTPATVARTFAAQIGDTPKPGH